MRYLNKKEHQAMGEALKESTTIISKGRMSDSTGLVICRTCNGAGKLKPMYSEVVALLQGMDDDSREAVDKLIDSTIATMQIKQSKRPHVRRLLETFCRLAVKYDGI
jgi:hypothetical protein